MPKRTYIWAINLHPTQIRGPCQSLSLQIATTSPFTKSRQNRVSSALTSVLTATQVAGRCHIGDQTLSNQKEGESDTD